MVFQSVLSRHAPHIPRRNLLTSPDKKVYLRYAVWNEAFDKSPHIPRRNLLTSPEDNLRRSIGGWDVYKTTEFTI